MSERGGGGFGLLAEWVPVCGRSSSCSIECTQACSAASASCTPLCGVGEQCNSWRWWSATPKTSSEIPPVGHESGPFMCRCFNGPTPLSVVRPSQYPTIPALHFSPHNCIRICPMPSLCLMPISEGFMELSSPLLPVKYGLRGSSTLSMDIFASEDVTRLLSGPNFWPLLNLWHSASI